MDRCCQNCYAGQTGKIYPKVMESFTTYSAKTVAENVEWDEYDDVDEHTVAAALHATLNGFQ